MPLPRIDTDRANQSALAARALEALATLDLPTERDEMWRYTDVTDLDLSALDVGAALTTTKVVVDGSEPDVFGEGAGLVDPAADAFTALSAAFGGGPRIVLRKGSRQTVHLTTTGDSGGAALPTIHISSETGSESCVVLHHEGEPALSAPLVEIEVHDGAVLDVVDVQDLGPSSVHVATAHCRVGRDAVLRIAAAGLGARLSRLRIDADLAAPGCASTLLGVYFGARSQHFDFRTTQRHLAPRCRSEVLYKGAVANASRAVYSGLIYVAKDAQKTNGFQTNRNLVLSGDASAESIPKLEILANDVKCSHASAVGPVDRDHLYYLESRGIAPDVARRLVVFGFFEEVLRRVPDAAVQAGVRLALAAKFDAATFEAARVA